MYPSPHSVGRKWQLFFKLLRSKITYDSCQINRSVRSRQWISLWRRLSSNFTTQKESISLTEHRKWDYKWAEEVSFSMANDWTLLDTDTNHGRILVLLHRLLCLLLDWCLLLVEPPTRMLVRQRRGGRPPSGIHFAPSVVMTMRQWWGLNVHSLNFCPRPQHPWTKKQYF
jgi:hypothetical protein